MSWALTQILPESVSPSGKRLCRVSFTDGLEVCTESFYLSEGDDLGVVISGTLERWNDKLAKQDAAQVRQQSRSVLRSQWDSLPYWLREPFSPVLDAINILLDQDKIELAAQVIEVISALESYDENQRDIFNAVKNNFKNAVRNL